MTAGFDQPSTIYSSRLRKSEKFPFASLQLQSSGPSEFKEWQATTREAQMARNLFEEKGSMVETAPVVVALRRGGGPSRTHPRTQLRRTHSRTPLWFCLGTE